MKVSSGGRITIPNEIRDALGLTAGVEISIELTSDRTGFVARESKRDRPSGNVLAERLRDRGDVQMSTDEIMALTRGD